MGQECTKTSHNHLVNESLEVPDSEEVARIHTSNPRTPAQGSRGGRSGGETPPPDSWRPNNSDDDIVTGAGAPGYDTGAGDMMKQKHPPPAAGDTMKQKRPPPAYSDMMKQSHPPPAAGDTMKQKHPPPAYSDTMKQSHPPPAAGGQKLEWEEDDEEDSEESDDDLDYEESREEIEVGAGNMMKKNHLPAIRGQQFEEEDDEEDSEESEDDDGDENGEQIEGAYDPSDYEHLPVQPEIKELFQYIAMYTPQSIELDHKLKPRIPNYIAIIGDTDAFIKVNRPDNKPEQLGIYVLDEPCAKQSDPTVGSAEGGAGDMIKQNHPPPAAGGGQQFEEEEDDEKDSGESEDDDDD